jgi:hypothetical protein
MFKARYGERFKVKIRVRIWIMHVISYVLPGMMGFFDDGHGVRSIHATTLKTELVLGLTVRNLVSTEPFPYSIDRT